MAAEGYEAPIPQGLWRRVTTYGMPSTWFAVWVGAMILQSILALTHLGIRWGIVTAGSAVIGEVLLLQWITRQDMQWDELRAVHWMRRYASFYDAG
jgi:hypothetical protein